MSDFFVTFGMLVAGCSAIVLLICAIEHVFYDKTREPSSWKEQMRKNPYSAVARIWINLTPFAMSSLIGGLVMTALGLWLNMLGR